MIGDDLTDEQIDYLLKVLREEAPKKYRHLKRLDCARRGLLWVDPRTMRWGNGFIDQDAMNELAGYGPEE